MIEWAKFGSWSDSVGEQLAEFVTFDNIEMLYKEGYHMIDFNHVVIPIERWRGLRALHERYSTSIFSCFNGVPLSKNKA